jgi:3-methyladenine DNA glycosylase AlkD
MAGNKDQVESVCTELTARLRKTPQQAARIRSVRREVSKQIEDWPAGDVVHLALGLLEQGGFTNRVVAYELVSSHPQALASLDTKLVEKLGRGLDSWEAVDTFALYIAGQIWRARQIPDGVVHRWTQSRDRWWRRAALVSTVPLNSNARGGSGDADRTLRVCETLVRDRDEMVVKAMSWALRELSKREPRATQVFVSEHANELAGRVTREVQNKMTTGVKEPRRKTSKKTP